MQYDANAYISVLGRALREYAQSMSDPASYFLPPPHGMLGFAQVAFKRAGLPMPSQNFLMDRVVRSLIQQGVIERWGNSNHYRVLGLATSGVTLRQLSAILGSQHLGALIQHASKEELEEFRRSLEYARRQL